VHVEAAPGSVVGRTLAVRNTTPHPIEVSVTLEDWWYRDEAHAFAPPGTIERSAAVWSEISPVRFRLAASERREVQLELRVPPDARGGAYAAVFFEARPPVPNAPSMRIGSLTMVEIGDVAAPSVVLGSPRVEIPDGQVHVRLPVDQEGATHTFSQFKGIIRREDGDVVTRIASKEARFLPGQDRELDVVVDQPLEPGIYTVDGVLVSNNTGPLPVPSTRFVVP
jgi:hypothetical protein